MNPLIVKGVVFGLLLACAALWDMKEREIPNLIPAMILVCGLIELRPAASVAGLLVTGGPYLLAALLTHGKTLAMVLALVVRIAPVFVAKQNLDVFADELVRTAEINGQVGSATSAKAADLREQTGLDPNISWSDTGKIQLGNEVEVTLTTTVNIGLFGEFASFPVTLTAKASGTSEVYWK